LLKAIKDAGPLVLGSVRLDRRELPRVPTHRRAQLGLALVPEDRRMFPQLTVARILGMAASAVPFGASAPDISAPRAWLH